MSRLAISQTDTSRRRPRPLPWFDPRLKGIADGPTAKAKKWIAQSKIYDQKLTAREYATIQEAYDYFNQALFDGTLPQVLITLQRHGRAFGYFSSERFQSRDGVRPRIHEVALNPEGFRGRSDERILSTLAHEMVHVWQKEYGKAGRGRYHNRQFAAKMHGIGLMPSATGKPAGRTVHHFLLPVSRTIPPDLGISDSAKGRVRPRTGWRRRQHPDAREIHLPCLRSERLGEARCATCLLRLLARDRRTDHYPKAVGAGEPRLSRATGIEAALAASFFKLHARNSRRQESFKT